LKFELSKDKSKLILKESTREEYNQLRRVLSPYVKNYRFMERFKHTNWDGKLDFFNNGYIDFGLWNEVYKCCKEYGYSFNIINKEEFPRNNNLKISDVEDFCKDFYKNHKAKGNIPFYPYEHQIEAIQCLLKHRYGSIEVATSGGKSLIFSTTLFYLLKNNPDYKFLLIVPSLSLVTQFYDDILDYNLGFNKDNENPLDIRIQEIMSDKPRKNRDDKEPNVYIGTYQSLINYGTPENQPDFYKQFNVVCVDEGHKAKSITITTIMKRTFGYSNYRFSMSGTYPDEGTAERLSIESVTGPVLKVVKAKELMEKGLVSNAKIKCLILQHEELEFAQSVYTIKKNGGGKKAYQLESEFIQKSEKRKLFVSKLINKFKHNSLVLFHNIEYGKELYNYCKSNIYDKNFYYIDGGTSGEKRQYIIKEMENTDGVPCVLIASYGTLSTGVSIKALKNMVMCQPFVSPSLVRQSIGRMLRLHETKSNGEKAIIFDLVDQFHHKFKNTLYGQFETRKNKIYIKEEFVFDETKIVL
jgi:superfamily II DNA or RNA helicase